MLLTNICILMSLQLIIYFDYIDLISVTTLPAEIDLVPKSGDSKEASIEDLVCMTGEALTIYVAVCVVTAGYLYLIGEL